MRAGVDSLVYWLKGRLPRIMVWWFKVDWRNVYCVDHWLLVIRNDHSWLSNHQPKLYMKLVLILPGPMN